MNHKTKLVKCNGNEAEIDLLIAPLIKELWKRNIDTLNSCENNVPENFVWIQFMTSFDAELFLNIVTRNLPNIFERSTNCSEEDNDWRYSVFPNDINSHFEIDDDDCAELVIDGDPKFILSVSVRFPQSDLKSVINSVKKSPVNKEDLHKNFMFHE